MLINAKGKNCPVPVIMAKKAIDSEEPNFSILVDNPIAVENLKKLGANRGYHIEISESKNEFSVNFNKKDQETSPIIKNKIPTPLDVNQSNWVVFVGKDAIGEGDPILGDSLIKMYFYTIAQGEDLPKAIIFMNNGVKLPTLNHQVIEHLKVLSEKGCELMVCGACLNFYKLEDKLQVGAISNMYAITEEMSKAAKVITL